MQRLVSKLEECKYVCFTITQYESATINVIFCAHPESVKLFDHFSTVLIMDSTYEANLYSMPKFLCHKDHFKNIVRHMTESERVLYKN